MSVNLIMTHSVVVSEEVDDSGIKNLDSFGGGGGSDRLKCALMVGPL